MPVEIKEMIIRAHITDPKQNQEGTTTANETNNGSTTQMSVIVEQCVEQVMDILKREKER